MHPLPPHLYIPILETKPFAAMQWEDPGLIINKPTKPLDIGPFGIICKQVKSHSRHLEWLQEPSFYSDEGK
jgi:hypothetical protein